MCNKSCLKSLGGCVRVLRHQFSLGVIESVNDESFSIRNEDYVASVIDAYLSLGMVV